jgi:hypothetical protein
VFCENSSLPIFSIKTNSTRNLFKTSSSPTTTSLIGGINYLSSVYDLIKCSIDLAVLKTFPYSFLELFGP